MLGVEVRPIEGGADQRQAVGPRGGNQRGDRSAGQRQLEKATRIRVGPIERRAVGDEGADHLEVIREDRGRRSVGAERCLRDLVGRVRPLAARVDDLGPHDDEAGEKAVPQVLGGATRRGDALEMAVLTEVDEPTRYADAAEEGSEVLRLVEQGEAVLRGHTDLFRSLTGVCGGGRFGGRIRGRVDRGGLGGGAPGARVGSGAWGRSGWVRAAAKGEEQGERGGEGQRGSCHSGPNGVRRWTEEASKACTPMSKLSETGTRGTKNAYSVSNSAKRLEDQRETP